MDRVQLMVQRDKNRSSIVMWSMGNESAYGCNFEKALAWTKKFDPDRITQYESARYRNYDITMLGRFLSLCTIYAVPEGGYRPEPFSPLE